MGFIKFLYKKKQKAVRIFVISFFIMVLSLFALLVAQKIAVFNGFKGEVYRKELLLPFKKYIFIEIGSVPLKIRLYNGDDIKVSYINETDIIVSEKGYELSLKEDFDFSFSLFSKDIFNYKMELYLPDRIYNSITINSTSGDVDLDYLYTTELYISTRSGDVSINDAAGKIFIDNQRGDTAITFLDLTDPVTINTEKGDVKVLMPENKSPRLSFITDNGYFTGDFFRFKYNDYQGSVFLQMGDNPKPFKVTTKTGNLIFQKRNNKE